MRDANFLKINLPPNTAQAVGRQRSDIPRFAVASPSVARGAAASSSVALGAAASPSVARGAAASATTDPISGGDAAPSVNIPIFGGEASAGTVDALLNNGEQTESDVAETLSELGTYPAPSFGAAFENQLHEILSTGNVQLQLAHADGETASEEQARLLINAQAIAVQAVVNNLQLEAVSKRVAQESVTAASDSNAALLVEAEHKLSVAQTALATANEVLTAKDKEIAAVMLQLKALKDRHAEWISRVQDMTSAEDKEIDKLQLAATEKKRKFNELATIMADIASVGLAAAVQGESSAAGNAAAANTQNDGDM